MKVLKPSKQFWDAALEWAEQVLRENDKAGRKNKYDYKNRQSEVRTKARGKVGEMVVAKLTGHPYDLSIIKAGETMRRDNKQADVGGYIEVRTSVRQPAVYQNDPPGRVVVGLRYLPASESFKVLGWTYAGYARRPEHHSPFQGVERWLIPDDFWWDFDDLPDASLDDDYPRSAWHLEDEDEVPLT